MSYYHQDERDAAVAVGCATLIGAAVGLVVLAVVALVV